jgi:hypothetical protein
LFYRLSQLWIILLISNSIIGSDLVGVVLKESNQTSRTLSGLATYSVSGYLINFLRGCLLVGFIFIFIVQPMDAVYYCPDQVSDDQ